MGFTTIITCDNCESVIPEGADFAGIKCELEIDRSIGQPDVRQRASGVFCETCGNILWERIAAAFPEKT